MKKISFQHFLLNYNQEYFGHGTIIKNEELNNNSSNNIPVSKFHLEKINEILNKEFYLELDKIDDQNYLIKESEKLKVLKYQIWEVWKRFQFVKYINSKELEFSFLNNPYFLQYEGENEINGKIIFSMLLSYNTPQKNGEFILSAEEYSLKNIKLVEEVLSPFILSRYPSIKDFNQFKKFQKPIIGIFDYLILLEKYKDNEKIGTMVSLDKTKLTVF